VSPITARVSLSEPAQIFDVASAAGTQGPREPHEEARPIGNVQHRQPTHHRIECGIGEWISQRVSANVRGACVAENHLCFAIRDKHPVSPHHTLIIAKRHVVEFFELYQPELNAAYALLHTVKAEVTLVDQQVTGFNVGVNIGQDAGQTIMHAHVHLMPRRQGDVKNPRGGIRGVIPDKMDY
jgi:diadenosine tetraphosphate (Ap4A) HIT family hydrolase